MQLKECGLTHTASDLTDFLACGHLSKLEATRVQADRSRAKQDEAAALIAAKGLSHEARYLEELRRDGLTVIDLGLEKRSPEADAAATIAAMASGVDIVYQATFFDGAWLGRADFLRRVERPCAHWAWSYEVVDTKLSLSPRPSAVMQLCMYSEQLERAQGTAPEFLHIVLGDRRIASYRRDRFMSYYRSLKAGYLQHLDDAADTYPVPVAHCAQCAWSPDCEQQRADDDHLSIVAWMRRGQIERFATCGITTLAGLAQAADDARPLGMAMETFDRLRHQAKLQYDARMSSQLGYDLLPLIERQGFAKLPPASVGDVYFDMEGDPLYEADRGLEYLFGNYTPEGNFKMFWAHSPEEEQKAFEDCVDFFLARLAQDPQMHVYHYAPYEKVALRRLAAEFTTREDAVDALLRDGVFVDLYEIVRQGVMISQPSYSIKKFEPFYGFTRNTDVKRGDDSIVSFERWRADQTQSDILDDIQRYNEDDCRSTYELRCWLDTLKAEAEKKSGKLIPWNGAGQDVATETKEPVEPSEQQAARQAIVARLDVPHGSAAQRLLASVIPYHSREAKPVWWEYFDRCDNADSLTEEDGKALGGLVLDTDIPPIKPRGAKNVIYTYTFPAQKFSGDDGDMHDAYLRCRAGQIEDLTYNDDGGVVQVKVSAAVDPAALRTLIPHSLVNTREHEAALVALGEQIAACTAELPATFVSDILTGAAPRIRGLSAGATIQPKITDGMTISDTIARLQQSYLVVQGPPGTGKTTKGATAIVHLLSRGLKVGITSRSHAAIDHLLAAVDRQAQELGVNYRGVRKAQDEKHTLPYIHTSPNLSAQSKTPRIFASDTQLVAGTSWTFVGKDVPPGFLDVLVIDEAGQFSLADALAMHAVTKNLVLLGDPLQLKQVARGTHPSGADASILEHLLGEHATVPPDRGIFLDVSYRMHPDICRFISENIYDGRLGAAPQTATNAIQSSVLQGSGLRFMPLVHTGNSRDSKEEAQWICDRIAELANGTLTDDKGRTRALSPADILVVTPYNAQRATIERMLRARGIDKVAVGTVDKFQGQEAAVVFYSMATSTGEDLPRDIAFLYERNRFNVAISRAKALCVLVASPALLRPVCNTIEEMEMVNLLCCYVEEATTLDTSGQSEPNKEEARSR